MTHKQAKLCKGRRSRKVKQVEEEYETSSVYRRAVLLSSDDVDRMAVESSRARLINHLVSKSEDHSPREFASYYLGSTRYVDPPYSITSHTNKVDIPQVIPAYSSLVQRQRWKVYSRPLSKHNSETDFTMEHEYNCRCVHCTSPGCPGRHYNLFRPHRQKDNIMTFCDQWTMTSKVNDASCGRTSTPSTLNDSDMYVPSCSSIVAVKDTPEKLETHEYNSNFTPIPILKKCYAGTLYRGSVNKKLIRDKFSEESDSEIGPLIAKSVKCFYKKKVDKLTDDGEWPTRKNIYNEGISDVILVKRSSSLKKVSASSPVYSRSSVSSDTDTEQYIPFAHRGESKYHRRCLKLQKESVDDEGSESTSHHIVIPNPRSVCKRHASKAKRRCKHTSRVIRLPRRLLTSERVIDACVDKHATHVTPPSRRK